MGKEQGERHGILCNGCWGGGCGESSTGWSPPGTPVGSLPKSPALPWLRAHVSPAGHPGQQLCWGGDGQPSRHVLEGKEYFLTFLCILDTSCDREKPPNAKLIFFPSDLHEFLSLYKMCLTLFSLTMITFNSPWLWNGSCPNLKN